MVFNKTKDPDLECVCKAQKGDKAAFGNLVNRYYEMVYAVCFGVLHQRESARDVTQDVFLKVFHEIENFKKESKFKTWLYRVAMNAAIDSARKRRPQVSVDATDASEEEGKAPFVLEDKGPGPREKASKHERREWVRRAVEALSPDHRAVLVLREWEGLSYEEIAGMLDLELGTVMSRLFYARKKLGEILQSFGFEK